MKKLVRLWGVLAAFALATLIAVPANAQASRTWISGVGDDANPCSRTAPCKTFAGAISKTAAGGEIDCLDPGGFGGVTITKSITLDCGGGIGGQVGSILVAGTNGITVNAAATDIVKIRNLTINGIQKVGTPGLSGIKFIQGAGLIVEHVGIFGFGGSPSNNGGIDFEPGAGSVPTDSASLNVLDTEIQYGLGDGILIAPGGTGSATANLNRVTAMNNAGGGVNVKTNNAQSGAGVTVTVRDSMFSSNADGVEIGAKLGTAPGRILMTGSALVGNTSAGGYANGMNATLSMGGTTVSANPTGLLTASSGIIRSFGDNYVFGNTTDGAPNGPALTKE
ncbi:MAG TPA: hypothetical protein VGH02_13620 [Rhizomicrobium sp.]|jgi:hypothetical protein